MEFRSDEDKLEPSAIFSQSSLTDIVLLLLILFLLTSSFVTKISIKGDIPKAETGAQTDTQFINVAVTKEGKFYIDGKQTEKAKLIPTLREIKGDEEGSTLVLRADKDAIVRSEEHTSELQSRFDLV